jgi:hypothetical protein
MPEIDIEFVRQITKGYNDDFDHTETPRLDGGPVHTKIAATVASGSLTLTANTIVVKDGPAKDSKQTKIITFT